MKKNLLVTIMLFASITMLGCSKFTTNKPDVKSSKVAASDTIKEKKDTDQVEQVEQEDTSNDTVVDQEDEVLKERENTTFRSCKWGDDADTVKKYEKAEFSGELDGSLVYKGSASSVSASIVYNFDEDGKLYMAAYMFDKKANGGEYIRDYNILRSDLVKKYGAPLHGDDDIIKYQDDNLIEHAGESKALEYGYVAYSNQWETDETKITIGLSTDNYETTFILYYTDKNYEEEDSNDI